MGTVQSGPGCAFVVPKIRSAGCRTTRSGPRGRSHIVSCHAASPGVPSPLEMPGGGAAGQPRRLRPGWKQGGRRVCVFTNLRTVHTSGPRDAASVLGSNYAGTLESWAPEARKRATPATIICCTVATSYAGVRGALPTRQDPPARPRLRECWRRLACALTDSSSGEGLCNAPIHQSDPAIRVLRRYRDTSLCSTVPTSRPSSCGGG